MTNQRFILIIILFFQSIIAYLDRACIASAVGPIQHDLIISPQVMGFILAAFTIGYGIFQIPAGTLIDYMGPRKAITMIVSLWSFCTALTATVSNAISLFFVRFLFGASEAGALPGAAVIIYRWLPPKVRGIAYGINISGTRLGAAFALFSMPWLITNVGWRYAFLLNGILGLIWVLIWLICFRDNPAENKKINANELNQIEMGHTDNLNDCNKFIFDKKKLFSVTMLLVILQYFASNFTFFMILTWVPFYISSHWDSTPNAIYFSAIPLLFAACSNWVSGFMISLLYRKGFLLSSLKIPAIIGFSLGIAGLLLATQVSALNLFIFSLCVTIFGVDMTLSPSWSLCNFIGKNKSGTVSGMMNMFGQIGAATSAILFPILINSITGSANPFFYLATTLNIAAIIFWCFI